MHTFKQFITEQPHMLGIDIELELYTYKKENAIFDYIKHCITSNLSYLQMMKQNPKAIKEVFEETHSLVFSGMNWDDVIFEYIADLKQPEYSVLDISKEQYYHMISSWFLSSQCQKIIAKYNKEIIVYITGLLNGESYPSKNKSQTMIHISPELMKPYCEKLLINGYFLGALENFYGKPIQLKIIDIINAKLKEIENG